MVVKDAVAGIVLRGAGVGGRHRLPVKIQEDERGEKSKADCRIDCETEGAVPVIGD